MNEETVRTEDADSAMASSEPSETSEFCKPIDLKRLVPPRYRHVRLNLGPDLPATGAHFGEHLMLDGYQGRYQWLNEKERVARALNELPELLGMRKLSAPEVYFAKGNGIKDCGGWSGVVVIEESHISIHTFPDTGFVSIDAYTCRNGMDCQTIAGYFTDLFGLLHLETHFVRRGKQFGHYVRR